MNIIDRYDTVIWDFNGTLLDDVDAGIKSVNTMLSRRALRQIASRSEYFDVFGFPIIEYYRRLGFDFEKESFAVLADEWVAEYLKNAADAPLCHGVKDALDAFAAAGIKQYVLSMTEQNMLISQLEQLGIKRYFIQVSGLDNVQAFSKLSLAESWSRGKDLSRALFIGDTTHDYETAQTMGTDCLLIASGHQKRSELEKCTCRVVDSATELI